MQNISFCGQIHNGISEITKAKRQGKLGISASKEFFADKSGKIDTKTEIEKIPKTILSRVQKFEFNKIGREDIIKQIDIILSDRSRKEGRDAIIPSFRFAAGKRKVPFLE